MSNIWCLLVAGVRRRLFLYLRATPCLSPSISSPPWRLGAVNHTTPVSLPPLRLHGARLLTADKAETATGHFSAVSKTLNDVVATLKQQQEEGGREEVVNEGLESLLLMSRRANKKLYTHPDYPEVQQLILTAIPQLTPNQAGYMVHLCAHFQFKDGRLLGALVHHLQNRVENFDGELFGTICWALVRLNFHRNSHQLLDSIATEVNRRLVEKVPLDHGSIAKVCWSFAVTRRWPEQLTDPLIQFVEFNMSQIHLHPLSIIVWSLVKMGVTRASLFEEVAQKMRNESGRADNQSLCMLIWCFGSLSLYHEEFFHHLTEKILSDNLWDKCTPRLLSTLVWTCTRVRYYNPDLMDHIARHSLKILDDFNTHDLSLLAYGFGFLNHSSPEMLQAVAKKMVATPHRRTTKAVVNTMWGCLVADIYPVSLVQLAVDEVEAMSRNMTRSGVTYAQMLQLDLACRVEHPHLNLPQLSPEQLVMIFQELIVIYQSIKQRSRYDLNVHLAARHLLGDKDLFRRRVLSLSGYELDTEVLLDSDNKPMAVPESCYNLQVDRAKEILASRFQLKGASVQQTWEEEGDGGDSLMVASDWGIEPEEVRTSVARRVVFEADGPHHYAVNCHHPLGRTVLKHRQLRALGWEVISLPYYEWHPLNSVEEQAEFLKEALERLAHSH